LSVQGVRSFALCIERLIERRSGKQVNRVNGRYSGGAVTLGLRNSGVPWSTGLERGMICGGGSMPREDKTYTLGPITITKHVIEWDDIEGNVQRRLAAVPAGATVYLNPEYTVASGERAPTDQFVKQARRAQVLWNKRLARVLGAGRRRRAIKQADPATRQLQFTGIMLLEGKPVHPKGWPDTRKSRTNDSGP
jgi:hypothetical protein